jgi:mono/diheme cytochrome c family protein
MNWRWPGAAAAAFAGAALLFFGGFSVISAPEGPSQSELAQGLALYGRHCASCHGRNLEGQPNWTTRLASGRLPAPPHDASGHSWHHSDEALIGITKHGLKPYVGADYESDMPAFAGILSDEEIAAIIAYIKGIWPERERAYQAEMTRRARAEAEAKPD